MLGMVREGAVLVCLMELGMFKILSSVVVVLILSLALTAQTAEQIVARHIGAMGGLKKLQSVQNLRRIDFMDEGRTTNGRSTTIKARGGKFRSDSNWNWKVSDDLQVPMAEVQACDGQTGWFMSSGSNPIVTPGLNCRYLADIDGPLVDYAAKGNVIKLAGKTKIGDQKAYDLELTWKENKGHPAHFYIDVRTFLLVRILTQSDVTYSQDTFSDYRRVDGIMVAFTDDIQWWPVGQNPPKGDKARVLKVEKEEGHQKQTLEKIEFNGQIDDSIFAMPAPAATK